MRVHTAREREERRGGGRRTRAQNHFVVCRCMSQPRPEKRRKLCKESHAPEQVQGAIRFRMGGVTRGNTRTRSVTAQEHSIGPMEQFMWEVRLPRGFTNATTPLSLFQAVLCCVVCLNCSYGDGIRSVSLSLSFSLSCNARVGSRQATRRGEDELEGTAACTKDRGRTTSPASPPSSTSDG